MRRLRTCILGLAVCLSPVASRRRTKHEGRDLFALQDFTVAEPFAASDTVFPGVTFHEDKPDDLTPLAATWRATPKDAATAKGSKKSWSWKDPCAPTSIPKRSKKSPSAPTSYHAPGTKKQKSAGKGCSKGGSKGGSGSSEGIFPGAPAPGVTAPTPVVVAPTPIPNTQTTAPGGSASWTWPDGAGGPTIDVTDPGVQSTKCAATRDQTNPTISGTTTSTFFATVQVTFTMGDPYVHSGVLALFQSIQNILALWVVGCEALAKSLASAKAAAAVARRLQTGSMEYVGTTFQFPTTNPNCQTTGQVCVDNIQGTFVIKQTGVSDAVMQGRIVESFQVFNNLIPILSKQKVQVAQNVVVTKQNNRSPSNAESDQLVADDSVNVATVIGATAGGLAFLLLIVLLARRRTEADEVSHLKLNEDGEDTFIREFETTGSNPSGDEGYETRNVHVVGEADSIFSGWTGYTQHNKSGEGTDGLESNVHKCSSATCEVCEARRQQGIQFIPTHSPARPHIPSDASREYLADDTVEL